VLGERGEQRRPAPAVLAAGAAQVAVEVAAVDDVGERELLDDRGAAVHREALEGDPRRQALGKHEPAEPQPVGERLLAEPA
jgi:hypothetical protein